jgi:hypothetical protein
MREICLAISDDFVKYEFNEFRADWCGSWGLSTGSEAVMWKKQINGYSSLPFTNGRNKFDEELSPTIL